MTDGDAEIRIRFARERTEARVHELTALFDAVVASSEAANLDDEHDPEGSTVGFERAQLAAMLDGARARLEDLADASERVRLGTYGRCERCGDPIPDARLDAQPSTRTCVACAAR